MKVPSLRPLVVVLSLVLLVSCQKSVHDPNERYVFVAANISLPYWQEAKAGFTAAVSEMNVKGDFLGSDTYDPDQELQVFQQAVASNPAGIVVSAAQPKLFEGPIDDAIKSGIPVVTVDSDSPESRRMVFIGTDNYSAGVESGKLVAKLMHEHGSIAVLTIPLQYNLDERLRGVQDALKQYPYLKISWVLNDRGDPPIAGSEITQLLQGKTPIDAILCLEASGGPGAATAVDHAGLGGKITIVAMDANRDTLDWISKGIIAATVAQKPYTMSFYAVRFLDDLHHNRVREFRDWRTAPASPLPSFIDTGTAVIDARNVDDFRNALAAGT